MDFDPHKLKLLIIEDEISARRLLSMLLEDKGYTVASVSTVAEATQTLRKSDFDLVITDLKIGNGSGVEIIKLVEQSYPATETILLTAFGSIDGAVEAIHAGAFDYLTKPFNNEQLILRVKKALEHKLMKEELVSLREHLAMSYGFDNIIGISREISQLKETARRIASTDITVLITGPSGTGKELFARAIHHHSRRRVSKFVAIDCTAIPENLLESELFGHVKGSFTSAHQARIGLLEEAEGGTVFLDELGNMPPSIQMKLLRFLQDSVIRPVGSSEIKKVNVRIIGATNCDLARMVQEGRFRQDLYYRLNVVPLYLPPLTDRAEDIEVLVEYFMRKIVAELGRPALGVTRGAVEILLRHSWPGNVRELENTLKRAAALCRNNTLDREDILFVSGDDIADDKIRKPEVRRLTLKSGNLLDNTQRNVILKALADHDWNYTKTAVELGIGRTTLWRKIKKFDLSKDKVTL